MRVPLWLNIVLSQVGWFACVLSAAAGRPSIGVAVAGAIIALHLTMVSERKTEVVIVAAAALLGAAADTALVQLGVLHFSAPDFLSGLTTPWMVALWAVFATTLRHAFAWLHHRLALAACLGAIGGPAAYLAGARLGALDIADSAAAYLSIGAAWALALPALLLLARSLDQQSASLRLDEGARWT